MTDAGAAALFGVMLFVVASAAITASGRLQDGLQQALSSRYVTGTMAFWAAQLCYWWRYPPGFAAGAADRLVPLRLWEPQRARFAVLALGLGLADLLFQEQSLAKPQLLVQAFAENDATNLLLLGLDDRAVILRAAWNADDVHRLLPPMRDARISIFRGADADALGRPVSERGAIVGTAACSGAFSSAFSDASLGPDGVRVAGTASGGAGRRLVRRVVLADVEGKMVGLASGANPAAGPREWSGYAVASVGAPLTAYALLDGARLCRLGALRVTAASPSPGG